MLPVKNIGQHLHDLKQRWVAKENDSEPKEKEFNEMQIANFENFDVVCSGTMAFSQKACRPKAKNSQNNGQRPEGGHELVFAFSICIVSL